MSSIVKELVERARAAQEQIEFWSQERVDEMVAAAGWEGYRQENSERCARLAVDETGLGVYEDKLLKQMKKTLGTLRDLNGLRTCGIVEDNPETGIIKIAKPIGVVGALTPMTNATSTITSNGLPALKGRNAIIFAPHPKAKKSCDLIAGFMRDGLRKVGAPEDLVLNIEDPTIELTQELMREVDLVIATGGAGLVKVAYSSGTPAYGVGAGNSVVVVDETADLVDACEKIFKGKIFDNATSCSSENSVIFHESVYEAALGLLTGHGGYLCNAQEKAKLKATMWPDGEHLNGAIVAQSAGKIAGLAGIEGARDAKFLIVVGEAIGPEDRFSAEKLSPVLTVWKYREFPEAIAMVGDITAFSGYGHSCGIHTTNPERIVELGSQARVSRMMVNQTQVFGNSGDYINGMPFGLTLGCGSWGGNATNENIHWKHFLNYTYIARPIPPVVPDEDAIFGAHWATYGK